MSEGPARSVPVTVLRLEHRRDRDKRITSHLGLVARAFGADRFLLAGDVDDGVISTLDEVTSRFGGPFEARFEESPNGWLRRFCERDAGDGSPGVAIHLTMYGEPHTEAIPTIRRDRPIALVVGGAKVPGKVYGICQHNVSIGTQPHSEVAALALFLDTWFGSVAIDSRFANGSIRVVPSRSSKIVESREDP